LKGIHPGFWICGSIAVWDIVTTIIGTVATIGPASAVSIMAGIIVSAFVATMLFMTFKIFDDAFARGIPVLGPLLRGVWWVALGYDIYTSFFGNAALMGVGISITNVGALLVIAAMTVLVVGASLVTAYLYHEHTRIGPTPGKGSF
jgi:hypothetical protein